jgi:hypothetical protein
LYGSVALAALLGAWALLGKKQINRSVGISS